MRWPALEAPPLDGFTLRPLPSARLAEVALALERSARLRRGRKGALLARKMLERAAEIRREAGP